MQISLEKFSLFLTGLVSVGFVVGSMYFLFTVFFEGPEQDVSPVLTVASVGVFGPKLQKATAALVEPGSKVSLNKQKNLQFLGSALFESFTENPGDISLSESRGRADPFVPYVAP